MRLIAFLFFGFMISVSANSYAQNTKLNLDMDNVSIMEIFDYIESNSGFVFLYNSENVDIKRKISIKLQNATINEVLEQLFNEDDVNYRIYDRQVVLRKTDKIQPIAEPKQERKITGVVSDNQGEPLIGVTVLIKGTNVGTSTDINGEYTLKVPEGYNTLVYSFIGMISKEVPIGDQNSIDITLEEDITGVEEVIVVAYGKQKRENLTGAVSTINLDKLDTKPITNLSQAFAGLAAGVSAVQSSSQPGSSGATIRIRGENTLGGANNTPLVVIDGAVGGSLNDISPIDVASISILKDASSTAIYGARAAAGVILITTKRGTVGKMVVKYDGFAGYDEVTELPDVISNSATYMELLREWTNSPNFPTDELIESFRNAGDSDPLHFPNTDWFELVMGGKGFIQSHTMSIRGGSDNAKIAASINYLDQEGIVDNTGNKRIGFRLNMDSKVSNRFTVGMNIFGNNSKRISPGGNIQSLLPTLHSTVPYIVPEYDGRYGHDGWTGSGGSNPVSALYKEYSERETNTFIGKIFASYDLLPNLKFTTSATVNNAQTNTLTLNRSIELWNFEDETIGVHKKPNSLSESNNRNRIITLNSILNYNTTLLKNHNIAVLLGYSQEENLLNTSGAFGKSLVDESIFVMDGPQDQTSFTINGNKTLNNLRSYFGRFNYDFNGKYLFEASFRYDGSSKFKDDVRWGFFPSASAGWNMHHENFMQNIKFITSLKPRVSIGKVGNNTSLGNYSYISTLPLGSDYPMGGSIQPGIYLNELANPELVWESTTTYGIGFDFGLFNNRLTGEIDFYKNRTDGILRRVAAPYFGGIPKAPFQNLAVVDAKGYEVVINYRNTDHKLKYSAGLTLSHDDNEIVSFNDGQFQEINGNYINKVGYAINSIYTYETEGIFRSQDQIDNHATQPQAAQVGDLIYKDQLTVDTDGDGKADAVDGVINADDRVIMDPAKPKLNLGLNLNFEYKAFDLNVLLQGALGYENFVYTSPARPFIYPGRGITGKEWINAYHETRNPDPNTTVPRLDENSGNVKPSDYWMHDFSFLRFKTIQLGYNLPETLIQKIKLTKGRIYVNGQNMFTLEDVPHFDPESVGLVYPLTKTLTLGVQLTF